jgi:hypothetical protein
MKINFFEEPEIEFANGLHICPRAGISQFDVYDSKVKARREKILVGGIGTSENLEKLVKWIQKCSGPIEGKKGSKQPNLFMPFCGVNQNSGFKVSFVIEEEITRKIKISSIKDILRVKQKNQRINLAVDLFYQEIQYLSQNRTVDVIVCIVTDELYSAIFREKPSEMDEKLEEEEIPDDLLEINFRRALKAKAMHLGKPIQIIREKSFEEKGKTQQDEATKAWNFCTAIYYKSSQTVPWKMITSPNRPSVCFAGLGFYRSRDKTILHTSLAQIFDELGKGVILRGTPVAWDKDDRIPHLTAEQAYDLFKRALEEYKRALGNLPGRLVVHKSSNFNQDELDGLSKIIKEFQIGQMDFVTILDSDVKVFRDGNYPPLRGLHVDLDSKNHVLYSRGFVKFYQTYPGQYIPRPLEIRIFESEESPTQICREILALTKMNWNNTQFDGKYPITLTAARKVGEIMKYLTENDQPQIRYSFYM